MANKVLPKARERMLAGGLNLLAGTVKAWLIDTAAYTYSDAHQFLSDIPSGARIGAPVTLANKSITNGVFDADDLAFSGLSGAPTIEALVYYVDTGTESTSPVFYFVDGQQEVVVSVAASGGATSMSVDRLAGPVANGAVMTKVSGTGPATITLTAAASAGARSLSVFALGGAVAAGDVYAVVTAGAGLPIAAGATGGTVTHDNGANKIFAV